MNIIKKIIKKQRKAIKNFGDYLISAIDVISSEHAFTGFDFEVKKSQIHNISHEVGFSKAMFLDAVVEYIVKHYGKNCNGVVRRIPDDKENIKYLLCIDFQNHHQKNH